MTPKSSAALKAAIIPTIVAGIFSLLVAFIGLQSGGKQAVESAIAKRQSDIDEMIQKQLQLKTGFIPGEIRSFGFGGGRDDRAVKDLRTLGWLECAGQELLIADYGLLYERIRETWGSSNRGISFSVPDLRGMFLRSWSDGSAADPEAGMRTAQKSNGAAGNKVGSIQPDALQTHTHRDPGHTHQLQGFNYQQNTGNGGDFGHMYNKDPPFTTTAAVTGIAEPVALPGSPAVRLGPETRPKNVYVMYCIYVGRAIPDPVPDGSRP
jgi:microcystin-dependent protein